MRTCSTHCLVSSRTDEPQLKGDAAAVLWWGWSKFWQSTTVFSCTSTPCLPCLPARPARSPSGSHRDSLYHRGGSKVSYHQVEGKAEEKSSKTSHFVLVN